MSPITTNSRPPLFALWQADGSRFELSQALGRNRILIAFFPTLDWIRGVANREAQLRDYELRVLAMPWPQVLAAAPGSSDWLRIGAAEQATLADYGVAQGEATAFLVGKDRGVKRVYSGEPNLDEVLSLIDTMPMRQVEVRRRD